jgi:hypothetical protein
MSTIFLIYLIIGFIIDLWVEYILHNIPQSIIDSLYPDIDINSLSVRFVMLLVCMLGWPFIIMNVFKDN